MTEPGPIILDEGFAAVMQALTEVVTRFVDAAIPLMFVPKDAVIVRPTGGHSKSHTWLAWDHDHWRPCWRSRGVWYWL